MFSKPFDTSQANVGTASEGWNTEHMVFSRSASAISLAAEQYSTDHQKSGVKRQHFKSIVANWKSDNPFIETSSHNHRPSSGR
jgi:hypothetical protein